MSGLGTFLRHGLGWAQGIIGLAGAGTVFFEAHRLFLRYYAREWGAIQTVGPNDCAGVERIANGDLIGGETFCNQPINFVPWVVVYEHHWQAAAAYYGAILFVLLLVGGVLVLVQRRGATANPYGSSQRKLRADQHEHLR